MSSDKSLARNIIVDGLPKNVVPAKRDVFKRHFSKKISDVLGHSNFSVHFFTDPATATVSGAILSFITEADAEAALAKLNLFRFTKADVLSTHRWSALPTDGEMEEEYVPPQMDVEEGAGEDFGHNMAEDVNARPQFIVKGGIAMDCDWYWFDWQKNEPVLYRRPNFRKEDPLGKWSEMDRRAKELQAGLVCSMLPNVRPLPVWSTYGTMVISQHANGLRVWGGRNMHMLFDIPESDVQAFMISPREKYIVIKTTNDLSVINLHTAKKIRTLGNLDLHTDDLWPIARFSADDSLVVVCKTGYNPYDPKDITMGKMFIYNAETMRVVQGDDGVPAAHTFGIQGLYKAEWNPKVDTQIAYVSILGVNQGWKVVISDIILGEDNIASESTLAQRNFLNAEKVEMLWHPAGTHLTVRVTLKKSVEFFMFQIGARSVAVIQLQIKNGYSGGRYAWQPSGDYFAMTLIKNVSANTTATLGETGILQVYSVKHNKLKLLRELTSSATNIFWAPEGGRFVAANFEKSMLHFISISESGAVAEPNKLSNVHFTDCQWDPTGRFFAAWVSSLRKSTLAPQYRIFDFNGLELFRKESKPFSHFAWRPLPPSLLTPEDTQSVKNRLKSIVEEYEQSNANRRAEELAKIEAKKREFEESYVKKMNDLARKMRDQGLAERREELQNSSKWSRYWSTRLKALPEDQRITHETITEERIISRRQITKA